MKSTGRLVAIKQTKEATLGAQPQRILREARLMSAIRHPSLVGFHGVFETPEKTLALVYELVEGEELSLEHLLKAELSEKLAWLDALSDGLEVLHAQSLSHRDLKPENVMIRRDGSAVLLDFGLLKSEAESHELTQQGIVLGTPEFMSPEALAGAKVGVRGDHYSFACLCYWVLEGTLPFAGRGPFESYRAKMDHPPRPVEVCPEKRRPAVDLLFSKALNRNPEVRDSGCRSFFQKLEVALQNDPEIELSSSTAKTLDPESSQAARIFESIQAKVFPRPEKRIEATRILPGSPPEVGQEPTEPEPPEGDVSAGARQDRVRWIGSGVALLLGLGALGLIFRGVFGGTPEPSPLERNRALLRRLDQEIQRELDPVADPASGDPGLDPMQWNRIFSRCPSVKDLLKQIRGGWDFSQAPEELWPAMRDLDATLEARAVFPLFRTFLELRPVESAVPLPEVLEAGLSVGHITLPEVPEFHSMAGRTIEEMASCLRKWKAFQDELGEQSDLAHRILGSAVESEEKIQVFFDLEHRNVREHVFYRRLLDSFSKPKTRGALLAFNRSNYRTFHRLLAALSRTLAPGSSASELEQEVLAYRWAIQQSDFRGLMLGSPYGMPFEFLYGRKAESPRDHFVFGHYLVTYVHLTRFLRLGHPYKIPYALILEHFERSLSDCEPIPDGLRRERCPNAKGQVLWAYRQVPLSEESPKEEAALWKEKARLRIQEDWSYLGSWPYFARTRYLYEMGEWFLAEGEIFGLEEEQVAHFQRALAESNPDDVGRLDVLKDQILKFLEGRAE